MTTPGLRELEKVRKIDDKLKKIWIATPRLTMTTLWLGELGSRFSITNISANTKLKSNGSKGSVRDSWGTDFCKNSRKSASLPCPFQHRDKQKVWICAIRGLSHEMDRFSWYERRYVGMNKCHSLNAFLPINTKQSGLQSVVLGAHKLRARRTVCKSVLFQRYKLLTNNSGPILA